MQIRRNCLNRCRRAWTLLLIFILSLTVNIVAMAGSPHWEQIDEGLHQDPVTGDFVYITYDKEKTSDIYYRTQGFTIADAYKDANGNIVETNVGEFTFALSDPKIDGVATPPDANGIIKTTWTIPQSVVMEKIAATSPEWYNKIMNPSGEVYLKMDAILAVQDKHRYDDPYGLGEAWSGSLLPDGTYVGEVWDKHTYEELKALYGWDPSYFDNHFDKALLIALGLIEDDNNQFSGDAPIATDLDKYPTPGGEMVDIIGKRVPDFRTYNYDPTGRFNIGQMNGGGIPTSEDVTNGYNADEWYGWSGISKRSGATHSWTFSGNISWDDSIKVGSHYDATLGQMVDDYVDVTRTKPYSYTVKRTVRYWYLDTCAFYDLDNVLDENEVFPGGQHSFTSYIETQITCTVNGIDLTSTTSISYVPNDDYHVDWPVLTADQMKINVHGSSEGSAAATFNGIAEGRVIPAEEIYVRNDELTINGNTYMSGGQYQYKDFHENKGEPNTYSGIGGDDYGLEEAEERGTIPSNTANGDYGTSITANYKQVVLGTRNIKSWNKSPDNTSIGERIVAAFLQNELVRVHTPTISPVEICDPDTHEKLKLEDTDYQLVPSAVNNDAQYQLLLDGTYTIKFIPEEHMEHIGYPEMAPDLYNKYCKFKQCAFPFTIQLDGKIYEPDDSTTDKDGDVKLAGYTEWIDLPDFTIDDFYIPSWTTEGYYGGTDESGVGGKSIRFRVAPENVEDQYGVNHIDDVEYLKNATLNGEPLYNYVSTYYISAQVSGRIYDFQAVGINDKDMFGGLAEGGYSNGYGYLVQNYAFCPGKEEKRSGTLNRLGGTSVRYTVDGTTTNNWDERNTLPFSIGRSQANKAEGTLRKGDSFAFTVRTMANLWDEEQDYIVIKPTFRYISKDGTVNRDVDVYSTTTTADGKERLYFVEYGSTIDTSNWYPCSISDLRFDGSYYTEDLLVNKILGKDRMAGKEDDVDYSRKLTNEFLYKKNIGSISTYPREVYVNNNAYLRREDKCYCMSQIVLNSNLRLLTGNVEQLERNLDKEGAGLTYVEDKTNEGASYYIKSATNPELWDMHRKSMQTWYGCYFIPNQLYVTDDKFKADADGDGVEEEYDTIWDYAEKKGYVEGNEDFIKNDGYLVINFEITTVNNGKEHLSYYGSNADQWQIEGAPDKVKVGDKDFGEEIEVPVESGDVAIVDLEKSTTDGYYVGYNRIN